MIQFIRIKNFQSLQDVELELGRLTVIVGPSSSGKSALIRAFKAVSSNSLDSDNITQGSKHSSISVTTDIGTVTIERNSNESSTYKVAKLGSKESAYSKLNRQVPSEVTEVLGITPSTKELDSINFAAQHDAPYLLTESSSSVARILGELTNVSTIFAAVKEANRRAKNSSGLLNLRTKDLAQIVSQISEYTNISNQASALTKIEIMLSDVERLEAEIVRLGDLLRRLETASEVLQAFKKLPELPDPTKLLKSKQTLDRFLTLIKQVGSLKKTIESQLAGVAASQSAILRASDELHQHLIELGCCPLCNQNIKKVTNG